MTNELQEKLDAILLDKNTNLKPEHLKAGVTCLGVEGVIEEGEVELNNQDKTITENGEYTADEGYTGLGTVTVSVENAGEIKLFASIEAMNADTNAKPGDKAIVYSNITNNSTADTKLRHIYFPEIVTLDTAITTSSTIAYKNDSDTDVISGTLNKTKLDVVLPTGENIIYYSTDGITYNKADAYGNDFVLNVDYYWNTVYAWDDVYGKFILSGGMTFSGLYEYNGIVNRNYMSLPMLDDINNLKDGTIIVKHSYSNKWPIDKITTIIKKIYADKYESKLTSSGSFGIFQAGSKLYAAMATYWSTFDDAYRSNELLCRMEYTGDNADSTLVPNILSSMGSYSSTQTEQQEARVYRLNIEEETYTQVSSYPTTAKTYNTQITVSDLETFAINCTYEEYEERCSYDFEYVASGLGTTWDQTTYCKSATPNDIYARDFGYHIAPTQLTVRQGMDVLKGLIAYGRNGVLEGAYDGVDTSAFVRCYKTLDELNADTSANDGDLAVLYDDRYKGIVDGTTLNKIYLPEKLVSEVPVIRGETEAERNWTACALVPESSDYPLIDYCVLSGETFLYHNDNYEFIAYYRSDDGITYTLQDDYNVGSGQLSEELLDAGFAWDPETNILTFPCNYTLDKDTEGEFIYWQYYNEQTSKIFTAPAFNFYGLYKFNGTSWELAPTQLNAVVSDIITNKTVYSKDGVITGDGSIYDNLDVKAIFRAFYGTDNVGNYYSDSLYAKHGVYNAAKLYTALSDNQFIKGIKCTPYTGNASNAIALMPYISPLAISLDGTKSLVPDRINNKLNVIDTTTNAILIAYDIAYLMPSYYTENKNKTVKAVMISNDECILYTCTEKTGRFYKISLVEPSIQQLDVTFSDTSATTSGGISSIYGFDKKNGRLYYGGYIEITTDAKYLLVLAYIDINNFTNNFIVNQQVSAYSIYLYGGLTTNREFVYNIEKKSSSSASATYELRLYGEDLTLIKTNTSAGGYISSCTCYPLTQRVLYDDGTYLYYGNSSYRINKSTMARVSYSDTNYSNYPRYLDFDFKYGSGTKYNILNYETGEILTTYKSFSSGYWYPSDIVSSSQYLYPTAIADNNGNMVIITDESFARMNMFDVEFCEPVNADYILTSSELHDVVNARTGKRTTKVGDQYIYTQKATNQCQPIITEEEYNEINEIAEDVLGGVE